MAATTGRKPYCFDHVRRMPYLAHVAGEVERRQREAVHVAGGGAVDVHGLRAAEIEGMLQHEPLDLRSLKHLTELSAPVLRRFLRALEREERIRRLVSRTPRGRARTRWASAG